MHVYVAVLKIKQGMQKSFNRFQMNHKHTSKNRADWWYIGLGEYLIEKIEVLYSEKRGRY